jgi:hypothetical protein
MQFEHASGDAPTKMSHTIVEKAINGDISRELQVDILKMHCKVPLYRALISEKFFFMSTGGGHQVAAHYSGRGPARDQGTHSQKKKRALYSDLMQ